MSITAFVSRMAAQGIELYPNDGQLGVRAAEGALTPQLIAHLRTHKQDLLAYFAASDTHPLSYNQTGLWFELQFSPESTHYHLTNVARLFSVVDVSLLQQAFQRLVNRHPILRTTIIESDGQPLLQVHHYQPVAFTQVDASASSWDEIEAQVDAYHNAPFDLANRSFHVYLLTKRPNEHVLVMKLHHMLLDGRSMSIIQSELRELYLAAKSQRVASLPTIEATYGEYVAWQQSVMEERGEALRTYWREQLGGTLPVLNLPTDRSYQETSEQKVGKHRLQLPTALLQSLRGFAGREGVTLSTLLLATYNILLHRYSGQDDIVVGSMLAGRHQERFGRVLGYFLSPIAVRATFTNDVTVRAFLKQFSQTVIGGMNHQDYPLPLVVRALNLPHVSGRNPLFQATFNMQRMHQEMEEERSPRSLAAMEPANDWDGLQLSLFRGIQNENPLDLTLYATDFTHRLQLVFSYDAAKFNQSTIEQMGCHFITLLSSMVADPTQRVQQLTMLAEAEYRQIVHEWNATAVNFGKPQTIQQLFEQQVTRTPAAIALRFEGEQLTYTELNERANQLAHHLLELGVQADTLVAVAMERSLELVVSLLAVLKAGGAYVPIDPTYPAERIQYMLADSATPIILTQSHLDLAIGDKHLIAVDQFEAEESLVGNPQRFQSADSLAYVIYTSGSTGRPKGVAIEHRAAFNYLQWALATYGVQDGAGSILHSPLAFDLTVTSIWSPLLAGNSLTILPESDTVNVLLDRIDQLSDLSFIKLTPAHLQLINHQLEPYQFAGCTNGLIIGGEALHESVVAPWRQLAPETRLINEYGPTEATVGCVVHTVAPEDDDEWVKIGRPIANTQIYILDGCLQPVPIGVVGELYIGGAQLARGYLNRPELTAVRFITHPTFGRLYKTGDLCRWLRDGTIAYIGRTDFQVKIHGFRIELGEIESALRGLDGVDDAVVIVREDGAADKQLVAYYTGESSHETVREQLTARLPHHMIPTAFVSLDALPLTANGKVDRLALPTPDQQEEFQANFTPPRSEIERVLAQAFADVLRLPQVGIHDDFFRMGGDSILSIQLVNRIAQNGYTIRVKDVFVHPTIAKLATAVQTEQVQIRASQAVQHGYAPLSPIQWWFLDANQPQMHHYNQSYLLSVTLPIEIARLESAIGALLQHHDALRFQYKQDGRGWQQQYMASNQCVPLEVIDLSGVVHKKAEIEAVSDQVQTSLNPVKGELTRWVYFKGEDIGDRLLIVIHHLAVDGVSWRILLEDLANLLDGKQLPPKTSSYREWVETLQAETVQGRFDGEIARWLAEAKALPLPLNNPDAPNTMGSSHLLRYTLSREQTAHLLRTLPERHAITVDALLLTALTETLTRWAGHDALRVRFESHGRQELFDTINLNRTVGWFTSVYPLTIPCFAGTAVRRIRYTLDTLRRVTDGGVSFGALRDYHPDADVREQFAQLPAAPVLYNYLGQMDGGSHNAHQFVRAPESSGRPISADFQRDTLVEINAMVIDGQLRISWMVSPQISVESAASLLDTFTHGINLLITEALDTHERVAIPTDFTNVALSKAKLESVLNSATSNRTALIPSIDDEEF